MFLRWKGFRPTTGTVLLWLAIVSPSGLLCAQTSPDSRPRTNEPAYLDYSLPVEERVKDLLSRMTLDEKISQMGAASPGIPRLGVPPYDWSSEGIHGVALAGPATVFPQAIGLAAAWDKRLVHQVADVISTEARAKYNDAVAHGSFARHYGLTFWSPNINIFRDPRWGRGQETYGEDPFLTARLGVEFITGMQGDDPRYLKTIATPKHFAVHSGPEAVRDRFNARPSAHDFADTYTPAFRAAVVEAKAGSVMCSYNAVDGVPACANDRLFDLLRTGWKFRGYVTSDCGAVENLYKTNGYVVSWEQAAAIAVKAGTDLDCGEEYEVLPFSIRNRLVSPQDVERSVGRLFEARFRLGMFDPPERVPWSRLTLTDNDTEEHRQVALEAAHESIVLLKNRDKVLPLKSSVKTIAVVGPNAAVLDGLLGNYTAIPSHYTTILEGIQKRFSRAKVTFSVGAPLSETSAVPIPGENLRTGGPGSARGLTGEYFGNASLEGTALVKRVDESVNFFWNEMQPAEGIPVKDSSVRWTGELVPESTGDYRLGATSAGSYGLRLYMDGKCLIDRWASGETPGTVFVHLEGGHAYPIRLEYSHRNWESGVHLIWRAPDFLDRAVTAARKADVVIAVVGVTTKLEEEGHDRTDLDLPRPQEELLEALGATGKPLVVVLTGGSALAVNWAAQHASAILEAWYPGEEGGTAVADVLAGSYNPAGRLPITFYKSLAQLPPFGNYSMRGRTYRYFSETPLYPFGYGLSFTSFAYSGLTLSTKDLRAGDSLSVNVDVKNNGGREGDEVVEAYLRFPPAAGAPLRALRGFTRIHLAEGESRRVHLTLDPRDLSMVNEAGERIVPEGFYRISVGGGQPGTGASSLEAEFVVRGEMRLPE